MARFSPYSLHLQISRALEQGQAFFCPLIVQDWLRDRRYDPEDYHIEICQQPAPPGSGRIIDATVRLTRKDGTPVDSWLLEQLEGLE